jgi:3-oxoacyl-ACP reductase-like protein
MSKVAVITAHDENGDKVRAAIRTRTLLGEDWTPAPAPAPEAPAPQPAPEAPAPEAPAPAPEAPAPEAPAPEAPAPAPEAPDFKTILVNMYGKFAPEKIANIDYLLEKYKGKEKALCDL